ncbi:Hypothetical predicted protein, partial [Olea europaea subsp. europaea]
FNLDLFGDFDRNKSSLLLQIGGPFRNRQWCQKVEKKCKSILQGRICIFESPN